MLSNLFPRNSKNKNKLKIVFREKAVDIGEHGTIYVDSVKYQIKNEPISFAFVGIETMPHLDVETLTQIKDQAAAAGFSMIGLRSYATVVPVMPRPRLNMSGPNPNAGKPTVPGQKIHAIPHRRSEPDPKEVAARNETQGRSWRNPRPA